MPYIELTKGYRTLVDEEDFAKFGGFKYYAALVQGNKVYAARRPRIDGNTKKTFTLHRDIMGESEGLVVDHINGNSLDNRRSNLRFVTQANNCRNCSRKKGKSGFFGVSELRNTGRFMARIYDKWKNIHIGVFNTAEEAAKAHDEVAKKLHGQFARLNFQPN